MRALDAVLTTLAENTGRAYSAEEAISLKVAFALKIMADSPAPVQPAFGPFVRRIEVLGSLAEDESGSGPRGAAEFFCDSNGFPAGLFTWALLDERGENGLLKGGVDSITDIPARGNRAWVIDAAVGPSGDGRDLLHSIRRSKALCFDALAYQRIVRGKRLSKRASVGRLFQVRRDHIDFEPVAHETFAREWHHLHLVGSAFDEFVQMGAAARLLARTEGLARAPVQFVDARLNLAMLLGQYLLVLNADGRPEAFVSWFRLSEDVFNSATSTQQAVLFGLQATQWNEGNRVTLADAACATANAATVAAQRLLESQVIARDELASEDFAALHRALNLGDLRCSLGHLLWKVASSRAQRSPQQPAPVQV